MIRRAIGLVIFLVGVSGVGLAVSAYVQLPILIDTTTLSIDTMLRSTSQNLDIVEESLVLTKATLHDVGQTLATVETSMDQMGQGVNQSLPLLDQVANVASTEVPESIEAVQTAIPDLAEVARIVDDTLTTLNRFRIDESFFGFDLNYSLGIDYAPERPFDETVLGLGEGLEGLPGSLRSLQIYANVTRRNLEDVSRSLFSMADDIGTLNGRLTEIDPLLDEYLRIVIETNDSTRLMRSQIQTQSTQIKMAGQLFLIWFGLSQLAPLVLGWELMRGNRA